MSEPKPLLPSFSNEAIRQAFDDAYEQARMHGLCADGAREYAFDVVRQMERQSMRSVAIKRIYDAALPEDGTRVLVDRLWPRGVSKEKAKEEKGGGGGGKKGGKKDQP